MNWAIIILVGVSAVALIVFLIISNRKDEKIFEDQLNNDYHKPKNDQGDIEIEDEMK